MSTPTLPLVPITEPPSKLVETDDVSPQPATLPIKGSLPSPATKTTPAPTTDYGEPTKISCLHLRRSKFSQRFAHLLRLDRLKKNTQPAVPVPDPSDQESSQPSRIADSEYRGRSRTAKLPSNVNRPPTLYDDGQGSWTSEFGYLYRGQWRLSLASFSVLSLGFSADGLGARSDRPDGRQHGVASRTPQGSIVADNAVEEHNSKEVVNSATSEIEVQRGSEDGDEITHVGSEEQHVSDDETRCESCDRDDADCRNCGDTEDDDGHDNTCRSCYGAECCRQAGGCCEAEGCCS